MVTKNFRVSITCVANHGGELTTNTTITLGQQFQSPVWRTTAVNMDHNVIKAGGCPFQSPVWRTTAVNEVEASVLLKHFSFQSPVWRTTAVNFTWACAHKGDRVSITCVANHGGERPPALLHEDKDGLFQSPVWRTTAVNYRGKGHEVAGVRVSITCVANHGGEPK